MRTPITVYLHCKAPIHIGELQDLFDETAEFMTTFGGGVEIVTTMSFSEVKRTLSAAYPTETYYLAKVSASTFRSLA